MFFLYNSNRTERLIDHLAELISRSGGQDLFEKTVFLVQNREIKRLISQWLADSFGVWGNSEYLLPLEFFQYVCRELAVPSESSAFDRRVLAWRLESLLRELNDPAMQPIRAYLDGEQAAVKRYQLARQTAELFDQYQIMRPDLIRSWDRGRSLTANPAEQWQCHLWERLRRGSGDQHRGEVIDSLVEHLDQRSEDLPAGLKRVFVFGLHTLPPLFLSVLKSLARLADVHFFLLTPCRQYWGDMETRRQHVNSQQDEPLSVALNTYHPLLAGLGRQGADFQELLLNQVEETVDGPDLFEVNAEQGHGRLLHLLQDDLLEARYQENSAAVPSAPDDDSVVVVSCHSRMRETAVLKDYILKWLTEDPQLGLHDIAVMAPDIQMYADLIGAVFDDVTHDVSDCRKRRDNRYVEIFSQFLGLFTGRYGAPDILGLLDQPEVRKTFLISIADLDMIGRWVKDAGIRWGLSETQRRNDQLFEFESGTWLNGLERLLLGLASGSKETIGALVPYDEIGGGEAELLGNLCLFIELIDQSRCRIDQPQTLEQWSTLLHEMSTGLFGDDDAAELLQLQDIFASLAATSAPHHQEVLPFEVVRRWFEYEAETTTSTAFLRGRLSFCSMLPMRSMPFKIICLLGINDGEFPKQDRLLPFDLLSESYKLGDRSRRADDRYQFLEAILAARQRLYISYIGQSIRSNEPIPPSPVVSELLESIDHCYGPIQVVKHPLQPFNESYFNGRTALFSHNRYYCQTAESLRTGAQAAPGPWLTEPLEPTAASGLDLSELASFVKNPQRYFIRRVMNLHLQSGEELVAGHEPFSLEALDRYLLSQKLVDKIAAGCDQEALLDELQQEQAWPLGFPGTNLFAGLCADIQDFVNRIAACDYGPRLELLEIDLAIGPVRLTGALDHRYHRGLLLYRYGSMRGSDVMQAWLLHLIAGTLGARQGPTTVVARNEMIVLDSENGGQDDLQALVDIYLQGCRYPASLFVEPAFSYGRQILKNRGRGHKDPAKAAIDTLTEQMKRGYVPELDILYPETNAAQMLDDQFRHLAEAFMVPILDRAEIVAVD